ncbi:MAG TPA: hypothetical protein VFC21_04615 [Bryobacteraceae bacterium]|nr:hypothetical protein [Bryobacteraceae bacterium]
MRGLLIASCLIAVPACAVIVDRIAITVGNKVITESEIDLRVRLTAFENGDKPDFSNASRKTAADRLVDQKIVEREMDVGHYPRLTGDARSLLLDEFTRTNYKSDAEALDRALSGYSITVGDLEEDLARQSDLLNFLSLRFRPAVQVSDQDVRQYFDTKIRPKETGQIALNDFRAQIERQITSDRADADMEAWLRDQRRQTKIEYLEKDLAP